ncbi:MAG: zinc ribbon domain-containing protein [Acidimicrobiales bacterium]
MSEEPAVSPEGGGGADPMAVLLAVQDLDTAIAQLRHRRESLEERRQLLEVEGAMAALATESAALGVRRQELQGRQAELEEQIGALTARSRAIEERMFADRNSAARDLQAMDAETHHLNERRAELEEVELAVMEEQEPVDAELDRLADQRAQLEGAADSLRAAVAAADVAVAAELSALEASRSLEAARLPADLFERYETLRARLGGVGAARLVGNRCDGCHLELPSAEVDRIRHLPAADVVTCDQCGRILVRAPRPSGAPAPAAG